MTTSTAQLGLFKSALESLTREMAVNLRRAAFSSIVREARDFSVALADRRGGIVAQAECIPIMTAGVSIALQAVLKEIDADSLTPDDAVLYNDPFKGGQHLQDIYLFSPIFIDDELVAFSATTAHHVDVGGAFAGLSADATEVYQEGLRLPLAKFSVSRDWSSPQGFVRRIIENNVRVPNLVIGDLEAQFAANAIGATRLHEIFRRFGHSETLAGMSDLQDYSERRFRAAISEIPDGEYRSVQTFDGRPWGLEDVEIVAAVTVSGEMLKVDFTGSGDQLVGNVNCPFASTVSAVQSAIRCMIPDRTIPFNEGCNRPIEIIAPYGSILNPAPPAAVRARLTPASRAFNAVVQAMGEAVPASAVATGFDTTTAFAVSHLAKDGNYQVVVEILGGGWGGCRHNDGADALDNPISNCANAPVESLETDYSHFIIDEYSLTASSAGEGRQRGGHGLRRVYRAMHDGVGVAGYADRHLKGPEGRDGGESGGPGQFRIIRADGTTEQVPPVYQRTLNAGDRIEIVTGGGGGYGDPADRSETESINDQLAFPEEAAGSTSTGESSCQ
ncbi:MAG: hydantoinase B/oxoprolinase family protein [Gulosibacter sp.]|uniref:hydantoinase B/oxoprolinase family protein n=1 Tax=Gulosibacter sp. TaxID=2817531 RepID=UPI003F8F178C